MLIGSFVWLSVFVSSAAQTHLTAQVVEQSRAKHKVIVFLSQKCPCSRGHVAHLNELYRKHSEVAFYGVISEPVNAKNKKAVKAYFTKERFAFPIIRDDEQNLVKKYKALKTPHVTFLSDNKVVYQGGVTDQKSFRRSSKKFLEVNLKLLAQGKDIKFKLGASLGCYIRRY